MPETNRHIFEAVAQAVGFEAYINTLKQAEATARVMGVNTGKATELMSVNVRNNVGKSGEVISRTFGVKFKDDMNRNVSATFKDTGKSTEYLSAGIAKVSKSQKEGTPIADQFITALKRVAIVVPVWATFRVLMREVTSTLRDGLKSWEDFSKALLKVKGTLQEVNLSSTEAISIVEKRVEEMSRKTGISVDKISTAFYRFSTLALGLEKSLAGTEGALRLTLALQGDLDETARALAFAYKLLGNTLDQSIDPAQQFELLGAKLFKIWQINAFEANEFSGSLQNFIGTAKVAGLSLDETIALLTALSTAGILGSKGGRQLRTSLLKFVENIDDVSGQLGILRREGESTFSVFKRTLDAIVKISEEGKGIDNLIKTSEPIGELFGGVRSQNAIKGLVSVMETLDANIAITNQTFNEGRTILNQYGGRITEVTNDLSTQLEIFRNLRKETGRAFIKGITQGDEFKDRLQLINENIKANITSVGLFSRAIGTLISLQAEFFTGVLYGRGVLKLLDSEYKTVGKTASEVFKGLTGQLNTKEIERLIRKIRFLSFLNIDLGLNTDLIIDQLRQIQKDPSTALKVKANLDVESVEDLKRELEGFEELTKGDKPLLRATTKEQLDLLNEQLRITKLQALGFDEINALEAKLYTNVKALVDRYNELVSVQEDSSKAIEASDVFTKLLEKDYEGILKLTNKRIITEKELVEFAEQLSDIEEARAKRTAQTLGTIIDNELAILKIYGASARQVAETRIELASALGIEQDSLTILKNQFSLEQAITEEKLNQKQLSSDALKLYRIAQRFGVETAEQISEVLAGNIDFERFEKEGGKALLAFRREFGDIFEQVKAKEFFEQVGRDILIPEKRAEEVIRQRLGNLVERLAGIKFPEELSVHFPSIELNINVDTANIRDRIMRAISEALNNPISEIAQKIRKLFEEE